MTTKAPFGLRFENALRRWAAAGAKARRGGDFAAKIGVSPAAVSQWKLRGDGPPLEQGRRAAEELAVDPGWLYFGEDSGAPAPAWWPEVLAAIEEKPPETVKAYGAPVARGEHPSEATRRHEAAAKRAAKAAAKAAKASGAKRRRASR